MTREQIVIIDEQPETVIDAAAVASLVRKSPLGPTEALRRLQLALSADHFAHIRKEYDRA